MKHPTPHGHTATISNEDAMDILFDDTYNPAQTMGLESKTPPAPQADPKNDTLTPVLWVAGLIVLAASVGFYLGMTWQKNADAIEIHEKKTTADLMIAQNTAKYAWVDMLNGNIEHIAKAAHSCHMANNPNTPGVVACGYIFEGIKDDAMAWPVFDENKLAMAVPDTPAQKDIGYKGTASKFLTPQGGQ
jgi:hypothetical protein